MKSPHNISGLFSGILSALALLFSACGTVNVPPLDDAYYWPDKKASIDNSSPVQSENVEPSKSVDSSAPAMEILSAKDTTITVRIKR